MFHLVDMPNGGWYYQHKHFLGCCLSFLSTIHLIELRVQFDIDLKQWVNQPEAYINCYIDSNRKKYIHQSLWLFLNNVIQFPLNVLTSVSFSAFVDNQLTTPNNAFIRIFEPFFLFLINLGSTWFSFGFFLECLLVLFMFFFYRYLLFRFYRKTTEWENMRNEWSKHT